MNIRRTYSPAWLLLALLVGLFAGFLPLLVGIDPLLGVVLVGGLAALLIMLVGWPFSAVAILILAALLTRYRFDVGPISVRAEHIAAVVVGGLALVQLAVNRGRIRFPPAAWFAVPWWLMNMVAGLFFSPNMATGVQNAVRVGLVVVTFILVLNLIPNRRSWWMAVILFLAAGIAEAAFGIVARLLFPFGVNLGVQVAWNFTEPIPYGTFEEGNLFGSHVASWAIVVLMILLALGIFRPSSRKLILLIGLGILLLGLFLSLSRAAWLMFAAGAGLAWIFYRMDPWHNTNRFLILLAATPFVLFLILGLAPLLPESLPFVNRLQSFLTLSTDATFSARLSDWSLAWKDWLQQPLTGWGPGSFAEIHGELRARPAWISNLSLRLLQETGIFGAFFFFSFVFVLILPAVKVVRQTPKPLDRAAMLGLILSYLVLLGIAYQSTDGIWLTASWVHAGLIAAGTVVLAPNFVATTPTGQLDPT